MKGKCSRERSILGRFRLKSPLQILLGLTTPYRVHLDVHAENNELRLRKCRFTLRKTAFCITECGMLSLVRFLDLCQTAMCRNICIFACGFQWV